MGYISERLYKNLPSALPIQVQEALPPMAMVRLYFLHPLISAQFLLTILCHNDTYTVFLWNYFPALLYILHFLLLQCPFFLQHMPLNPLQRQLNSFDMYMNPPWSLL